VVVVVGAATVAGGAVPALAGPAAAWSAPAVQSRLSPRRTAEGTVDGCAITIEYGSPSKRGRVIWGGLRPWDEWWMPGADRSTSITTSAPLMIGTLRVPAGVHTIYTLPGESTFLLIINNQTGQFHTHYEPRQDLGRTPMTLTRLSEPVEQMTFTIEAGATGGGTLTLAWDDRAYAVPLAGVPGR
jgi:hypothetical protein